MSIKNKVVRVKANVLETPAFLNKEYNPTALYRYYKAGEEIGIDTDERVFPREKEEYTLVKVLVTEVTANPFVGLVPIVRAVYVLEDDVDIISNEVKKETNTVVLNANGEKVGTLDEYPNAVSTGKTTSTGEEIYIIIDKEPPITEPTNTLPTWLKYGLWAVVILGSVTALAVLYKTLSK